MPRYVAAVVNAGGMGFIMALGWTDPEAFRAELRKCSALTGGKPFGVNLYISRQAGGVERAKEQIRIMCEEKVGCVETAGASPEPVIPILREAGIKIIHKVPAVKYAFTAERLGVDAVIIVGAECGGHPGIYQIGSMVQAAHGPSAISLPVVIGGGIGTGRQIAATLAMGAEGVVLGSRMLVAEEMWIHRKYKELVVAADGTESVVVKKAIRDHHRVYNNDSARAVAGIGRSQDHRLRAVPSARDGHTRARGLCNRRSEQGHARFRPSSRVRRSHRTGRGHLRSTDRRCGSGHGPIGTNHASGNATAHIASIG